MNGQHNKKEGILFRHLLFYIQATHALHYYLFHCYNFYRLRLYYIQRLCPVLYL